VTLCPFTDYGSVKESSIWNRRCRAGIWRRAADTAVPVPRAGPRPGRQPLALTCTACQACGRYPGTRRPTSSDVFRLPGTADGSRAPSPPLPGLLPAARVGHGRGRPTSTSRIILGGKRETGTDTRRARGQGEAPATTAPRSCSAAAAPVGFVWTRPYGAAFFRQPGWCGGALIRFGWCLLLSLTHKEFCRV
jgi:hypothetical protein